MEVSSCRLEGKMREGKRGGEREKERYGGVRERGKNLKIPH
jgi:hypothetical protein